jgi:NAD-dependent DNA ligase
MAETWKLARADGVVTPAELRDIEILAGLLGVPATEDHDVAHLARTRRSVLRDWAGKTVCFTGTSLARVNGTRLERADLQRFAAEAGMVVKGGVSSSLDLLVVSDPATRSGKAKKADQLGVRKMYDVAFLRALGVDCDAGRDEYVNP